VRSAEFEGKGVNSEDVYPPECGYGGRGRREAESDGRVSKGGHLDRNTKSVVVGFLRERSTNVMANGGRSGFPA